MSLRASSLHLYPHFPLHGPPFSKDYLWQALLYGDFDFLGWLVGWAWVSSGSNMQPRSCFSNLNMHENHPDSDLVRLSGAWRYISNKLSGAVRPEKFRFNSSGVWPSHQNFEQGGILSCGACLPCLSTSVLVLCFQFKTWSLLKQEDFSGYPVLLRLPLLIPTNTAPSLRLALLRHHAWFQNAQWFTCWLTLGRAVYHPGLDSLLVIRFKTNTGENLWLIKRLSYSRTGYNFSRGKL